MLATLGRQSLASTAALPAALLLGLAAALAGPWALVPLAAVAAVYVLVRLPGVVLAAYLLIPFYKGFAQDFLPVDLTVVLALANTASLAIGIARRERLRVDPVGLLLWLALTVLVVAGTLYARDQDAARDAALNWLALVAVPLLAVIRVAADHRAVRQLLWTGFLLGSAVAIVGLVGLDPTERLVLLGANTLGVARAAVLVPIIGLAFLAQRRSAGRWAALALIPPAIIVAVATGSRGPLLGLAVVAIAYAVARARRHPGRALALGAVLLAVTTATVLAVDLPGQATARIALLVESLSQADPAAFVDTSTAARLELYRLALYDFAASPLVGHGTEGFHVQWGPFIYEYPHNLVVEFATDYGFIGLLLIGAVLVRAFRRPTTDAEWTTVRLLVLFFFVNALLSGSVYEDRTFWGLALLPTLATRGAHE